MQINQTGFLLKYLQSPKPPGLLWAICVPGFADYLLPVKVIRDGLESWAFALNAPLIGTISIPDLSILLSTVFSNCHFVLRKKEAWNNQHLLTLSG